MQRHRRGGVRNNNNNNPQQRRRHQSPHNNSHHQQEGQVEYANQQQHQQHQHQQHIKNDIASSKLFKNFFKFCAQYSAQQLNWILTFYWQEGQARKHETFQLTSPPQVRFLSSRLKILCQVIPFSFIENCYENSITIDVTSSDDNDSRCMGEILSNIFSGVDVNNYNGDNDAQCLSVYQEIYVQSKQQQQQQRQQSPSPKKKNPV